MKRIHKGYADWFGAVLVTAVVFTIADLSAHVYSAIDMTRLNRTARVCMMDFADGRADALEEFVMELAPRARPEPPARGGPLLRPDPPS